LHIDVEVRASNGSHQKESHDDAEFHLPSMELLT